MEKIISFVFLVPSSMLSTVSALCAQNIGAGKEDRARETLLYAIMIAAGFGILVSILIQFIAEPAVGLFTADATVRMMGGQYIRGYIFDCIFAEQWVIYNYASILEVFTIISIAVFCVFSGVSLCSS